jgi:hypothetical protein
MKQNSITGAVGECAAKRQARLESAIWQGSSALPATPEISERLKARLRVQLAWQSWRAENT